MLKASRCCAKYFMWVSLINRLRILTKTLCSSHRYFSTVQTRKLTQKFLSHTAGHTGSEQQNLFRDRGPAALGQAFRVSASTFFNILLVI